MMSPFGVIFSDPWCHQLMLSATVPSDPCRWPFPLWRIWIRTL